MGTVIRTKRSRAAAPLQYENFYILLNFAGKFPENGLNIAALLTLECQYRCSNLGHLQPTCSYFHILAKSHLLKMAKLGIPIAAVSSKNGKACRYRQAELVGLKNFLGFLQLLKLLLFLLQFLAHFGDTLLLFLNQGQHAFC